jgi:hypothetical protein
MSADEFRTDQRSSVKIAQTAKGDPTVEVKAYSHDLDNLEETRKAAVAAYKATIQDLGSDLRGSVMA